MFCRYDALRDLGSGKLSTFWLAGGSGQRIAKARSLYKNADVSLTCDALKTIARMRSPCVDEWTVHLSIPKPRPKLALVRMSVFLKGLVVIHHFQAFVLFDICQEFYEGTSLSLGLNDCQYAAGVEIVELDDFEPPPRKRTPKKIKSLAVQNERYHKDAHLITEHNYQIAPPEEGFGPGEFTETQLNATVQDVICRAPPGLCQVTISLWHQPDTNLRKRGLSFKDESGPQEKIARTEHPAPEKIASAMENAGNDFSSESLLVNAGNENVKSNIYAGRSLQGQKRKRLVVPRRRQRPKEEERIYILAIDELRSYTTPAFYIKLQRAKSWMTEVASECRKLSCSELIKRPILEMVNAQVCGMFKWIFYARQSCDPVFREKNTSPIFFLHRNGEVAALSVLDPGDSEASRVSNSRDSMCKSEKNPAKRIRLDSVEETIDSVVSHGHSRFWDGPDLKARLSELWATRDGPISFYEICPKGEATRKDAAKVMSTLLDLYKAKQLILMQDAPPLLSPILTYPPSF